MWYPQLKSPVPTDVRGSEHQVGHQLSGLLSDVRGLALPTDETRFLKPTRESLLAISLSRAFGSSGRFEARPGPSAGFARVRAGKLRYAHSSNSCVHTPQRRWHYTHDRRLVLGCSRNGGARKTNQDSLCLVVTVGDER